MLSLISKPSFLFVSAATLIIIFTIVITAAVQGENEKSFSQISTAGPVWKSNAWICTSDAEFMVHAALIAYEEPNRLTITISSRGSQPDFQLGLLELESFSVGAKSGDIITITRSGIISGYITLQTLSGATAGCVESIT